jgi:hypothetical protein
MGRGLSLRTRYLKLGYRAFQVEPKGLGQGEYGNRSARFGEYDPVGNTAGCGDDDRLENGEVRSGYGGTDSEVDQWDCHGEAGGC